MSKDSPSKAEALLIVFTDRFVFLWLVLAVAGMLTFRYSRGAGILLCAPAIVFFAGVFVMLIIANWRRKTKGQ